MRSPLRSTGFNSYNRGCKKDVTRARHHDHWSFCIVFTTSAGVTNCNSLGSFSCRLQRMKKKEKKSRRRKFPPKSGTETMREEKPKFKRRKQRKKRRIGIEEYRKNERKREKNSKEGKTERKERRMGMGIKIERRRDSQCEWFRLLNTVSEKEPITKTVYYVCLFVLQKTAGQSL